MTLPPRALNDRETFRYALEIERVDGGLPLIPWYPSNEPRWIEEARLRGVLTSCESCEVSAKPHYHIDGQKYRSMPKGKRG